MKLNFQKSVIYIIVVYPITITLFTAILDINSITDVFDYGSPLIFIKLMLFSFIQGAFLSIGWLLIVASPIKFLHKINVVSNKKPHIIFSSILISLLWTLLVTYLVWTLSKGNFINGIETAIMANLFSIIIGTAGGLGLSHAQQVAQLDS